ncbi:hypothetical protein EV356DRAFT_493644 [Viridothelium virens]|uniref:Vacuolar ATPase assembly protein VMA22 n=1 Tax=Viridothelium virens TaxID=1048519 RepID=A0A6A6GUN0_VIRVR|nr:hypothetical protein EV356DRAFT_493644 [Viridothelium virens]
MTEIIRGASRDKVSNSHTPDDIHDRLDELWERYLGLLDRYRVTQEEVARCFSSGFMSLAQANFNSPNRMRYGQDYYDERMQAIRTLSFPPSEGKAPLMKIASTQSRGSSATQRTSAEVEDDSTTSTGHRKSRENNLRPLQGQIGTDSLPRSESTRDPLKWFGILVPPALRAAQQSFETAVEGPLVKLAAVKSEISETEAEIRRTRKVMKARKS